MTHVEMTTTFGSITLELDSDKAPKTVENFLSYVNDGFYNGTIFHRVIDNFMIQGGGFDANMQQKPTADPIENEAEQRSYQRSRYDCHGANDGPAFRYSTVFYQRKKQRLSEPQWQEHAGLGLHGFWPGRQRR